MSEPPNRRLFCCLRLRESSSAARTTDSKPVDPGSSPGSPAMRGVGVAAQHHGLSNRRPPVRIRYTPSVTVSAVRGCGATGERSVLIRRRLPVRVWPSPSRRFGSALQMSDRHGGVFLLLRGRGVAVLGALITLRPWVRIPPPLLAIVVAVTANPGRAAHGNGLRRGMARPSVSVLRPLRSPSAEVAQLVERATETRKVPGSIPGVGICPPGRRGGIPHGGSINPAAQRLI